MNLTRRDMLLASIGLLAGGCTTRSTHPLSQRSSPSGWHEPIVSVPPHPISQPVPPSSPIAQVAADPLAALARSKWTNKSPIGRKVKPMNGIRKITVHHEGWKPFYSLDARTTANRIEQIRRIHVHDRGWGDIGYHYVLDRAGRLWQGRPLHLQGAHVKDHNEHNLGVMVLGNFDRQDPSKQQIDHLGFVLRALVRRHGTPVYRVKTHKELMPTACPGRKLQPIVSRMRSTGYIG